VYHSTLVLRVIKKNKEETLMQAVKPSVNPEMLKDLVSCRPPRVG